MRRIFAILSTALVLATIAAALVGPSAQAQSGCSYSFGIALIRYSNWVSPSYVKSMAAAINTQMQNDIRTDGWGLCYHVYAVDALNGEGYAAGDWPAYIINGNSTWHGYATQFQTPVAYIDPTEWTIPGSETIAMENAASHGILEMGANPSPDEPTALTNPNFTVADCKWMNKQGQCRYEWEIADPVQNEDLESYYITSSFDNKRRAMSNYVTPYWYAQYYYGVKYDHMGYLPRFYTLGADPSIDCWWWNYKTENLSTWHPYNGC